MARAALNLSQITDPAQRVLAGKVSEVCDIFFAGFASLPPGERLLDAGKAENDEGRVRNLFRILALGAVVHLGRELDISMCDLHGMPSRAEPSKPRKGKAPDPDKARANSGSTQVPHLIGLHRNTCYSAQAAFVALLADKGDVAYKVEERFKSILKAAKAELADLLAKAEEREAKRGRAA